MGKEDIHHSEVLANRDLMSDAFDGENREHEMGLWKAAKLYPWACLWAFIMCFTIVSLFSHPYFAVQQLMPIRSWSLSTCS